MVQSDVSSIIYVGNNSTTAPYPVPFYFFAETDLLVTSIDSLGTEQTLQLHTDYSVQGAGNQNGGSILTTFQVPTNWHLRIERVVEPTQLTTYQEGDAFPALSHERALDKLTFLVQQALRQSGDGGGGGGGKAWANDSERQLTTPGFIGQLGFQVNTATIYYATSTTTGAWKKAIFDNVSATPGQLPIFSSDAHLTNIVIDGIATLTGGVLGATAKPAGDLVGTTQPQTLTNKTLTSPVIDNPTGLDRMDVGLGNVDNTSDVNKPISNATQTSLDQKEATINKGQNGGYAGLDATGKVPLNQMPQSVLGANVYQGTWNAATNTPTIPAAALDNQGWYWVVSVAGSTNIDGISTWAPGDWIISNGTAWERIINIDSVSSVNAMTGAVVVTKTHVGLSNVDNTSDATKNAAVATLTNKTLSSPVINTPTGLVKADVGLSQVDNTSDAIKNAAAATLTNKTIDGANNTLRVRLDTTDVVNNLPVSHLNGGSAASATTFWRGDGQWITPPGSGDVTGPAGAIAGEFATYANTTGKLLGRTTLPPPALPAWALSGLTLKNNTTDLTNDIDIAAGECRDDSNTADIKLPTVITKQLDVAWAVGTNQGGRDTGAIADNTWHVFAIRNPTTTVCDVLFSLSISAPTMPSGFTQKRRIASIIRRAAAIVRFRQFNDYFQILTTRQDNISAGGGSLFASLLDVPLGMKFLVHLNGRAYNTSAGFTLQVVDPDQTPAGAIHNFSNGAANYQTACTLDLWCNNVANLQVNFTAGGATTYFTYSVLGYWDYRKEIFLP
jgi:hypothetical protein